MRYAKYAFAHHRLHFHQNQASDMCSLRMIASARSDHWAMSEAGFPAFGKSIVFGNVGHRIQRELMRVSPRIQRAMHRITIGTVY